MQPYDTVVAKFGENSGYTFWYNGEQWTRSQLKTKNSQFIKFDVFDDQDQSYSSYSGSNFAGTNIFSYTPGSGNNDSVLGFPIQYTTNSTLADLTFSNDFNVDTFRYLAGNSFAEQKVNLGYLRQITDRYNFVKRNTWTTVNEPSRQYQITSKTYDGTNNYFEIDIVGATPSYTPTIKVFVNNQLLNSTQYQAYVNFNNRNSVEILSSLLTVGDKVDILIYSHEVSKAGYYQIPTNLDFNSKNEFFKTVTQGQLRNSLALIGQNLSGVAGSVFGSSNLRDLEDRKSVV